VLLGLLLGGLSLQVLEGRVGLADLAVGAVRLQHQPVQGHFPHHLQVLLGLEGAPVDADVEAQLQGLLELSKRACEGVQHPRPEEVSVLSKKGEEIRASVAVVQVEGQAILLGKLKVQGEHLELILLAGVV
jgi:hypothetical protein